MFKNILVIGSWVASIVLAYQQGTSRADFAELSKLLKGIKGKFIMSINDVTEIRTIFKGFYIKEVNTRYTTGIQLGKQAAELLINNADIYIKKGAAKPLKSLKMSEQGQICLNVKSYYILWLFRQKTQAKSLKTTAKV